MGVGGGGGGGGVVGKCVSKENPKSDLDLGLRVCQFWPIISKDSD